MSTESIKLTTPGQKAFAGVLLLLSLGLLYYLLPPLVTIIKLGWIALVLGVPLAAIVGYCIMYPQVIWSEYNRLSWNLTKKIISGDKLWHLYRYHTYLVEKNVEIAESVTSISAIKNKFQRKIVDINTEIKDLNQKYVFHEGKGASEITLGTIKSKLGIKQKSLESYLPKVVFVETQEKGMKELLVNYEANAEKLKYGLDAKAEEYELMKELAATASKANAAIDKNSPQYKMYQESLRQIEADVVRYAAEVNTFTTKVQPMILDMDAERSLSEADGMAVIEKYKQSQLQLKAAV